MREGGREVRKGKGQKINSYNALQFKIRKTLAEGLKCMDSLTHTDIPSTCFSLSLTSEQRRCRNSEDTLLLAEHG